MIRLVVIAALAPLAGCTVPINTRATCDARPVQGYLGQVYDRKLGDRIKDLSLSARVRAVRPGEMTTMEFNKRRVTIALDERNRVSRITCG